MDSIDFKAIGERLRAYRLNNSLSPAEVAASLGISRSAVYRLESGEIVKIETLEKLAKLFNTSISTLLGLGMEYYSNANGFFERMRQLENVSTHVYCHFDPFSYLLTSDNYDDYLKTMLSESAQDESVIQDFEQTLATLKERKKSTSHPKIINLISSHHLERFLYLGLVGTLDLSPSVKMKRILQARDEVKSLLSKIDMDNNIEVMISKEMIPNTTFQFFYNDTQPIALAISPFKLGEFPSLSNGIASVTTSKSIILQYQKMFTNLCNGSMANDDAKQYIESLLDKY